MQTIQSQQLTRRATSQNLKEKKSFIERITMLIISQSTVSLGQRERKDVFQVSLATCKASESLFLKFMQDVAIVKYPKRLHSHIILLGDIMPWLSSLIH